MMMMIMGGYGFETKKEKFNFFFEKMKIQIMKNKQKNIEKY